MVNVGINGVSALLGTRNGFLAVSKSAYAVAHDLVAEGCAVAKAEGFDLDADEISKKYYIDGAKVVGHNRCSMLQAPTRSAIRKLKELTGLFLRLAKSTAYPPRTMI